MRRKEKNVFTLNSQGDENLDVMVHAPKYTSHVGALVAKALPISGNLLELGSGDGQQTARVMPPTARLTCIEQSFLRRNELESSGYKVSEDLSNHIGSKSSALFTINCLEHIEDDLNVLKTIWDCLDPGGVLIIYVPALPFLFSEMDYRVGHFRRYTKKTIYSKLIASGFTVSSFEYVDFLGVIASFTYKLLPNRSGEPSIRAVATYDKYIFPISRILDLFFKKMTGKNILVRGVKN
jgi:SAM-dependent methyltransferase